MAKMHQNKMLEKEEEKKIDNPLKFIAAALQAPATSTAHIHCTLYKHQHDVKTAK